MTNSFWETKTLAQMTSQEWESLCDGCGQCCVMQLENEETNTLFFTDVACRLFDAETCRCSSYEDRQEHVPSCMVMDMTNIAECVEFAPPTCAYKLLFEGQELYPWHPLISGNNQSVHESGVSVRNKVISEEDLDLDKLEDRIIDFP